jgi:Na+/H+ antiporter NhaD/arsenite permease-like protein
MEEEKTGKFNFFTMFRDGFKEMKLGKTLWLIVIIKLCIMFLILRPFFFPNVLNSKYKTEEAKAEHVRNELMKRSEKEQLQK